MKKAIKTAVIRDDTGISNKIPGAYITTKSWSIKGVPRMIQTKVLVSHLIGWNFAMEPKEIISPNGKDISNVITKIKQLV